MDGSVRATMALSTVRWLVNEEAWVSDRPDDVDAAFAEIVADLEREGVGRRIPDLDDLTDTGEIPIADDPRVTGSPASEAADKPPSPSPSRSPEPPPRAWRSHDTEWDWSWNSDEEHYVPPDPPPLPKLRPLTIVALVLIVIGVVLLIIPTLVGLDARIATPIALLSITCGGGMLLLRARQNPKDPNARDDGAQL